MTTPADQQAQGVTELRAIRAMLEKLRGNELPRYAADRLMTLIADELSRRSPVRPEQREVCEQLCADGLVYMGGSWMTCPKCNGTGRTPAAQPAPREGERKAAIDFLRAVSKDSGEDEYWTPDQHRMFDKCISLLEQK